MRIEQPGAIHCFDCSIDYDFVGDRTHPGVCPACGGRAVSLAGDVEVSGVFERELVGGRLTTIDVVVSDETARPITYSASAFDGYAYVEVAVLGSARLKAGTSAWLSEIVPSEVVDALEDRGYSYVPCSERAGAGEGRSDAR